MSDPIKMAHIAAQRLLGTSQAIYDLGEKFEDFQNDGRFCAELDQLIFCCEGCNWWFEMGEMGEMADTPNGDWCCEECA